MMASKQKEWDVMISYEWKSGEDYAKRLNEYLKRAGYTVWIDKEQMLGDMLTGMAKAVSYSNIIILLISEGYSESHNCKSEYHHSHTMKKIIIPVKVENYHPPGDSALGILISGKIYYKLFEDFEANAKKILLEIRLAKENLDKDNMKSKKEDELAPEMKEPVVEMPNATKDKERLCGTDEVSDQKPPKQEKQGVIYNFNFYGSSVQVGDNNRMDVVADANITSRAFNDTSFKEKIKVATHDFPLMSSIDKLQTQQKTEVTAPNIPAQETTIVDGMQSLGISKKVDEALTPDEALAIGLSRKIIDFEEDFREELAGRLSSESTVTGNWAKAARLLQINHIVIDKMRDKGVAHRLLFLKLRDDRPHLKIYEIKHILEEKMKRKPRRDVFYKYAKKEGLPSLDREIGSLSKEEFEAILENIADELIADNIRGSWRDLGGHLSFRPNVLDEIGEAGKPSNATSSARMFINYLCSINLEVKKLVDVLEKVRRNDIKELITKRLQQDDCWIESCASIKDQ
ncbi:uncharacterized protein LOC135691034 isoform X2 [Rhopilema esculentum]